MIGGCEAKGFAADTAAATNADACSFVLIETRSAPALSRVLPLISTFGFPIYVARRPAAPFARCYPCSFTFYLRNPFPRFVVNELRQALNERTLPAFRNVDCFTTLKILCR